MDTRGWLNEREDLKPSIGLPLAIGLGVVGAVLVAWLIWLMFTDLWLFIRVALGAIAGAIGFVVVFLIVGFIYMKIEDFARVYGGSKKRNFSDEFWDIP